MIHIGIGEYIITDATDETITTHALGSCVALILYCKKTKHTAMAHIALPKPSEETNLENYKKKPGYFASEIVPQLIQYYRENLKCEKTELEVHLIGGADAYQEGDIFLVGQKNVAMVSHLLKSYGIRIYKEDTGGNVSRTVTIKCTNGHVHVKRQKMIL